MSHTILACPFCGSDDNVVVDEIELGIIAICCDECKTIGPHTDDTHSLEDAIQKWNKAPRQAAPSMFAAMLGQAVAATPASEAPKRKRGRPAGNGAALRRQILDVLFEPRDVRQLAGLLDCETTDLYTPLHTLKAQGLIVAAETIREGSNKRNLWARAA